MNASSVFSDGKSKKKLTEWTFLFILLKTIIYYSRLDTYHHARLIISWYSTSSFSKYIFFPFLLFVPQLQLHQHKSRTTNHHRLIYIFSIIFRLSVYLFVKNESALGTTIPLFSALSSFVFTSKKLLFPLPIYKYFNFRPSRNTQYIAESSYVWRTQKERVKIRVGIFCLTTQQRKRWVTRNMLLLFRCLSETSFRSQR